MMISILVPAIILSIFIMNQSKSFYDNRIYPTLEYKFSNDLVRIESFFSDSETELLLYTDMFDLNHDDDYIFTILDNFLMNNPKFVNAYYTNESGDDYLDHHRKPAVDGRERDWYKDAKVKGFTISEPYIDALTKKWVVTLSLPVYQNDAFEGVMGVDFLISDLVKDISNESNLSKTKIIISNMSDEIIYHDETLTTDEALELISFKTNDVLVKSFQLNKLHQNLYMVYSASEYNTKIERISYEMMLILVFIALLTLILASTASSKIAVPLNEFKDAIHHVNETHLTYSSGHNIEEWNEEFAILFSKFNDLVQTFELDKEKLEKRFDLLSKKNQTLLDKNIELEDLFKNQKVLDRRIRKSQQEYHSILNNINGMVWVVDNSGKIIFINQALLDHLSYNEDDLIGKKIEYLIEHSYNEKFQFLDMIMERDYKSIELSIRSSENEILLVESSTSRIFDQDKLLLVYGICRDVRASKQLQNSYNAKIQEQNLIMDLTETASMNMSLHQVTLSVFNKLNVIFGWSAATIRFLNDKNEFELVSKTSIGGKYIETNTIPFDNSCLGHVIQEGQILYVYDTENLPVEEPIYKELLESGYAIVFIPVGTNEIGRGVISITVEKSTLLDKKETFRAFTNTVIIVVERALVYEKLKKDYIRMIKVLAEAGDDKDSSSVGHSNRVSNVARKLGDQLYMDDDEIVDLEVCGLLHDIGKIGISDEYLSKDMKYTEIGIKKIKEHPRIGRKMLEDIGLSENILDGIEYHHINYDLSGYPEVHHLDVIPLFARIIRVADQFDNMNTSGNFDTPKDIWFEMALDTASLYCPQVMKVLKEIIDKKLI